jgi:hypothetical protein
MANTRKLDREIAAAQQRLSRAQQRDTTVLPVGDQAKLAALGVVVVAKATRLKDSPTAERAADRIWRETQERLAADVGVLQGERAQLVADEAVARRAKKSGGWW